MLVAFNIKPYSQELSYWLLQSSLEMESISQLVKLQLEGTLIYCLLG